jgi:hypothetical protein
MNKEFLSKVCFTASLVSVTVSIIAWIFLGNDPAHSERLAIFIGLWAPTLMAMSNHYKLEK